MTELYMLRGNTLAMHVIEQALKQLRDVERRWYAYRKLESAYLYLAQRGEMLGREFCEAADAVQVDASAATQNSHKPSAVSASGT